MKQEHIKEQLKTHRFIQIIRKIARSIQIFFFIKGKFRFDLQARQRRIREFGKVAIRQRWRLMMRSCRKKTRAARAKSLPRILAFTWIEL